MKCTTYRKARGKDVALESLLRKCDYVLHSDDSKLATQVFRQVCGTVFYVALFNIPSKELIDGRRYTIESVVASIEGFMRDDATNWLNNITDCSSQYAILGPHLEQILHEATVGEICSQLDIPAREFYLAAMRMYLFGNSQAFPEDTLEWIRQQDVELNDAWNRFEDCIYRKGNGYERYTRGMGD